MRSSLRILVHCVSAFLVATLTSCASIATHEIHNPLELYQTRNAKHLPDEGIQLGSSHTVLQHSGQWMDVTWQGVSDPRDDDFIALYAPANASVYHTSPVKYQWAVKDSGHRQNGAGTLRSASETVRTLADIHAPAIKVIVELTLLLSWAAFVFSI